MLNVTDSRGHRTGCSHRRHGLVTAVPCRNVHVLRRSVMEPGHDRSAHPSLYEEAPDFDSSLG
jgi:hypothetical protein